MVKQPDGLISVLLDYSAEVGDRDDAAMDLSRYDEIEAELALGIIATDHTIDENIADSCGESLGEIWCRKGRIDFDVFNRMSPVSKQIAIAYIQKFNSNLLNES